MTHPAATPVKKPTESWFEDTWWWRVKLRLQWTGWLQYMPNLMMVLLMLALAGIGALIGGWHWFLVGLPVVLASILFINLAFDVATVRYGLHSNEPLPRPLDDLGEFDLMRSRVSCRSFQKRCLTDAHRGALLALAATHSQPENCLGDHPIRFEYLAAPLTVWPVVGATEFLVAVAPRTYHQQAVVDVGRSLQHVVMEATRLGIATCWIGPGADPASIAQHLGDRFDPERDHVICVCAIGYASRYKPFTLRLVQKRQMSRLPLSELFFADTDFTTPLDLESDASAEVGRCYEGCRWSPSSYNGQTTRAAIITQDAKFVRADFAVVTKSRYYAMVALGIWLANWERGCRALDIAGRFDVVSPRSEDRPELPRYVVSWLRAR